MSGSSLVTLPGLPLGPPVPAMAIPGTVPNLQAGEALVEAIRAVSSLFSSSSSTGSSYDSDRLSQLNGKELNDFKTLCESQIRTLNPGDERYGILQSYINRATYLQGLAARRQELQNEHSGQHPPDEGRERSQRSRERPSYGMGDSQGRTDHPSATGGSLGEQYRLACEKSPESLRRGVEEGIKGFNSLGDAWSNSNREQQYKLLVANLAALASKGYEEDVKGYVGNLASPGHRQEVQSRLSGLTAARAKDGAGEPPAAGSDSKSKEPPSSGQQGANKPPESAPARPSGSGNGGYVQAPEGRPPMPPSGPYIHVPGETPRANPGFPDQSELQRELTKPGSPAQGNPTKPDTPQTGTIPGTPVKEPKKGDNLVHLDSAEVSSSEERERELESLVSGENEEFGREIRAHHNQQFSDDPVSEAEVLAGVRRMSRTDAYMNLPADDLVAKLLEPEEEAVRHFHEAVRQEREQGLKQQVALENQKVSALVQAIQPLVPGVEESLIESKVRTKMALPDQARALKVDEVVGKDLKVDLSNSQVKSIVFELKNNPKTEASPSTGAVGLSSLTIPSTPPQTPTSVVGGGVTPAATGATAVPTPLVQGAQAVPIQVQKASPVLPALNGFPLLPDNQKYWVQHNLLPPADNRYRADWERRHSTGTPPGLPSAKEQFDKWGDRLDFQDRVTSTGLHVKGEDVAKASYGAVQKQLPVQLPALSDYESAVISNRFGDYAQGVFYAVDPATVYADSTGKKTYGVINYFRVHTDHSTMNPRSPVGHVGRIIGEVELRSDGTWKPTLSDFSSLVRARAVNGQEKGHQVLLSSSRVQNLAQFVNEAQSFQSTPQGIAIGEIFKGATITTNLSGQNVLVQNGKIIAQEQGSGRNRCIWLDRDIYYSLAALFTGLNASGESIFLDRAIDAKHHVIELDKLPKP